MLGGVSGSQVAGWDLNTCDLMVLHFSEVAKHMTSLLCLHPGSDGFALY